MRALALGAVGLICVGCGPPERGGYLLLDSDTRAAGWSLRVGSWEGAPALPIRLAPHERVALVSHNFVLKVALCHLAGLRPNAFRGFTVDLTSLSTVNINTAWNPPRVTLLGLNDTCHLYGLNLQAAQRSL